MAEFMPLQVLYNKSQSMAITEKIATKMTGFSLPMPQLNSEDVHPYCVSFLLYFTVPNMLDVEAYPHMTRAYAQITLDLHTGERVDVKELKVEGDLAEDIGLSVNEKLTNLPKMRRRELRAIFFQLCDEAVYAYMSTNIAPGHSERLVDLLKLYQLLAEPPLWNLYQSIGKAFFTWLEQYAS